MIAGTSSGSSLWCALRLAEKLDRGNIVVLFSRPRRPLFLKKIYGEAD